MKLGTLQGVLAEPLDTVFETAARMGFAGVELDWNALEDARGEGKFGPAQRSILRAKAERAGVEIPSVAAHFLNRGGLGSRQPLRGRDTLDALGSVVAPGFIVLHEHAQDPAGYRVQVLEGTTTALELEQGTGTSPPPRTAGSGSLDQGPQLLLYLRYEDGYLPPGSDLPRGRAACAPHPEIAQSVVRRGSCRVLGPPRPRGSHRGDEPCR